MSTAFPLDILSSAMQRALIDLVCSGELVREGTLWFGKYSHRGQTVEALIGRGLARREGPKIVPTTSGIRLVGAEVASFNQAVSGRQA